MPGASMVEPIGVTTSLTPVEALERQSFIRATRAACAQTFDMHSLLVGFLTTMPNTRQDTALLEFFETGYFAPTLWLAMDHFVLGDSVVALAEGFGEHEQYCRAVLASPRTWQQMRVGTGQLAAWTARDMNTPTQLRLF